MNREKELREALNRILRKVQEDESVRLVILFGSLARGEVRETSDLDLIIVKETEERFLDRLDEYYEIVGVAADIFVYTPEEFEAMKESPFIKRALKEGVVVYEKGSQGRG